MYLTNSDNTKIRVGSIIAQDTKYGLLIKPNLNKLTPGMYGFHAHSKPKCGKFGEYVGGHLDPEKTNLHLGPYSNLGHLGDLPNIFVDAKGEASMPILAPKLKVKNLLNRALVIHAKSDKYDQNSYASSGTKLVCGVVPKKSKAIRKVRKRKKPLIKLKNSHNAIILNKNSIQLQKTSIRSKVEAKRKKSKRKHRRTS